MDNEQIKLVNDSDSILSSCSEEDTCSTLSFIPNKLSVVPYDATTKYDNVLASQQMQNRNLPTQSSLSNEEKKGFMYVEKTITIYSKPKVAITNQNASFRRLPSIPPKRVEFQRNFNSGNVKKIQNKSPIEAGIAYNPAENQKQNDLQDRMKTPQKATIPEMQSLTLDRFSQPSKPTNRLDSDKKMPHPMASYYDYTDRSDEWSIESNVSNRTSPLPVNAAIPRCSDLFPKNYFGIHNKFTPDSTSLNTERNFKKSQSAETLNEFSSQSADVHKNAKKIQDLNKDLDKLMEFNLHKKPESGAKSDDLLRSILLAQMRENAIRKNSQMHINDLILRYLADIQDGRQSIDNFLKEFTLNPDICDNAPVADAYRKVIYYLATRDIYLVSQLVNLKDGVITAKEFLNNFDVSSFVKKNEIDCFWRTYYKTISSPDELVDCLIDEIKNSGKKATTEPGNQNIKNLLQKNIPLKASQVHKASLNNQFQSPITGQPQTQQLRNNARHIHLHPKKQSTPNRRPSFDSTSSNKIENKPTGSRRFSEPAAFEKIQTSDKNLKQQFKLPPKH